MRLLIEIADEEDARSLLRHLEDEGNIAWDMYYGEAEEYAVVGSVRVASNDWEPDLGRHAPGSLNR